jgi:hypothetical protein
MDLMQPRVIYVELKSGWNDDGPAWISRVTFSKTGRTVYFHGRALRGIKGGSVKATTATSRRVRSIGCPVRSETVAIVTGGSGPVEVDDDVADGYDRLMRS